MFMRVILVKLGLDFICAVPVFTLVPCFRLKKRKIHIERIDLSPGELSTLGRIDLRAKRPAIS